MNTVPMLRKQPIVMTDGREAMDNVARSFWQSRMSRAGAPARMPQLTNLEHLARDVRAAEPYYVRPSQALSFSDALTAMFGRVLA